MIGQVWELAMDQPDARVRVIKILGTGAGNPTKLLGTGATITRSAQGIYLITWKENPGVYDGLLGFGFSATTKTGPKGYTVVADLVMSGLTLAFEVFDSTFAAVDLAAAQHLTLGFLFQDTRVNG